MKSTFISHIGVVIFTLMLSEAVAQFSIDAEANYIFSIPYNDVRIPSKGGTLIDIGNDLDTETTFAYRLRINYVIVDRHVISALAAPLTINSSGTLKRPIVYTDVRFAAGTELNAKYKFNSYRLTYRYLIVNSPKLVLGAGVTAKIRDANIILSSPGMRGSFPDLGFVPLINIYFEWAPVQRLYILLEGDALATSQGRAEDFFAGIKADISRLVAVKAGYRLLEGGADVTDNYNFSFINYAAAGIVISFR